ncbi:MAG: hypothetical protein ABL901_14360 [Hyphomicrobiaceae bacterium]
MSTQSYRSFGRRSILAASTAYAQRPARQAAIGPVPVRGLPLTVRYHWKIGLVGVAALALSYKLLAFSLASASQGRQGMHGNFIDGDSGNFVIAGIIAGLIGLLWLTRAISKSPALIINERGVEGFTLLGTKFIAWEDVKNVELHYHAFYKAQVTIHAIWGSKTGGWLGVTGIPIKIAAVDQPLARVLESIKSFRPDVAIIQTSKPPSPLMRLFMKLAEKGLPHH